MRFLIVFGLLVTLLFGAEKRETTLSMRTYKQLARVEKLISNKQMKVAKEKLQKMLENMPKSPIDRAYIYNTAGMFYLQSENYVMATKLLLQAYNENAFNEEQMLNLTELIGNLHMHNGEYAQAVQFYERYLHVKPDAKKSIVQACAVAYYQLERFSDIIVLLEKHIARFEPDESLYRMLFASYYELKQPKQAIQTVSKMLHYWNHKREYWLQQTALYNETSQSIKALESIELAHNSGVLQHESDYMQYIYLLIEMGIPYKAAELLEQFIKEKKVTHSERNMELLNRCYILSREKE